MNTYVLLESIKNSREEEKQVHVCMKIINTRVINKYDIYYQCFIINIVCSPYGYVTMQRFNNAFLFNHRALLEWPNNCHSGTSYYSSQYVFIN